VGNKPPLKARKVGDHRADFLSQREASKTELPYKTEKQTVNCNKTWKQRGQVEL
jgi:hypothetical protein